jgi:4-hydroxythreonine-4-phosphate dehydrogenase
MAKPLALTSGEPAGIGPDITIKAWLRRDELKLPAFYLLGDPDSLSDRARALGLNVRIARVRA